MAKANSTQAAPAAPAASAGVNRHSAKDVETVEGLANRYFDHLVDDPENVALGGFLNDVQCTFAPKNEQALYEFGQALHRRLTQLADEAHGDTGRRLATMSKTTTPLHQAQSLCAMLSAFAGEKLGIPGLDVQNVAETIGSLIDRAIMLIDPVDGAPAEGGDHAKA